MTKACADKQCRRAGQQIRLSEFMRNARRSDGHGSYCLECWNRYMREHQKKRKLIPESIRFRVKRKPQIKSLPRDPLVEVYQAIEKGHHTKEEIQRVTHLSYDEIGDQLIRLIWDYRAVRIDKRSDNGSFVLTGVVREAA